MSTNEPRTYFGWQSEKVNFLFGLTGRRATMIGAAAVIAIWPMAMSRIELAAVCWPIAAVLVTVSVVRINGRTSDEWATAYFSYQLLAWRNQHKFAGTAFTPVDRAAVEHHRATDADLPGVLAPLTILHAPYAGSAESIAIAFHRLDRTYTAVARVRFPGIGLIDSIRREQRVDAWGGLLAGLCTEGNPITRIQVLQRLLPESGAALRRWHTDHLDPAAPTAAVDTTTALLATASVATSHRDAYIAVTMDTQRAAHAIKAAGGGTAGAGIVLTRQLRALVPQIAGADLHIDQWLAPRDLAEVLRTAYDPHSQHHIAERRARATNPTDDYHGLEPGVDPGAAGPAATEARPDRYIHDGAHSVTYWIHDWPRNQIHSTALAPILGEGQYRRAVSLHIEPLPPRAAERQVMRERTARSVAVRMRHRTGQVVPEHERVALERAEAQDAERAAGHGVVRFTAYVTVTVTDPADLDDACAAIEADAAAARIEIRRMWFAQDTGFACSALPLGFGIPKKRW